MVLDGPINGELFQAYVDGVLVPELRPGDVVIMDNLGSHKGAGVRRAIEAAGASLLYLPPYSPDFNPIENAFSKLKALLRKAAARTLDELWRVIGDSLDAFNPASAGTYNPGQVVIFFDHRGFKTEHDAMGRFQNYWLSTKYRLGWPSIWYTSDLEPGKLRLVWYTVSLGLYVAFSTKIMYVCGRLIHPSMPAPRVRANTPCTWPTRSRRCTITSPLKASGL